MRRVQVTTTMPELKAKSACQSAEGEASTYPTAIKRALDVIFKRDGVKGRKFTYMSIKVSVLNPSEGKKGKKGEAEAVEVEE